MAIYQLDENNYGFPHPEESEEDGLIAVGGDLSPLRLLNAYVNGIFPWYNPEDPILWWSPDPRLILLPNEFIVSKSLKRLIKSNKFEIRIDYNFEQVITNCSNIIRDKQDGTWITKDVILAYLELHKLGFAHSFETYYENKLVGGLYGVSLGKAFFGESMFHLESNASKFAFYHLVQHIKKHNFEFIDCQMKTSHLISLGAKEIPRSEFLDILANTLEHKTTKGLWF